ncbi:MAG: tRNA (adenosine(37)-N6)-dimethylallyltransferase MiaA [Patescibacteria group bacterium]
MKTEIVAIVGPTATGKSDFAVDYALAHNGEVISADSRQVYIGLDIGTGKITQKEMRGVKHHLLDILDPKKRLSVEGFKKLAQEAIVDISSRGKLPILCGGTGFYIDTVIKNITYPDVPHDKKLQKKLLAKKSPELFAILSKLDPKFAKSLNNSERNNPHRLVRSIEIAKALGKVPPVRKASSPYDVTWIGLTFPDQILKERINLRLKKRIKAGMLQEAKKLHAKGLSWKRMEALGLEYRYLARHLQGKISKEEMIATLEKEIWQYAKRQKAWFKRNKKIEWVEKMGK